VAADALIIPVRVDQHSIEALKLTLDMLKNPNMDFRKFNNQRSQNDDATLYVSLELSRSTWTSKLTLSSL
jgi:cellulose biosynthesis protein BcsQ